MRKIIERARLFLLRNLGGVDRGEHHSIVAKEVRKAHENIASLAYRYAINDAIEACAREQTDVVARQLRRVFSGEAPAIQMQIANPDAPDAVLLARDERGFESYMLRIPMLSYRFVVKKDREVKTFG